MKQTVNTEAIKCWKSNKPRNGASQLTGMFIPKNLNQIKNKSIQEKHKIMKGVIKLHENIKVTKSRKTEHKINVDWQNSTKSKNKDQTGQSDINKTNLTPTII